MGTTVDYGSGPLPRRSAGEAPSQPSMSRLPDAARRFAPVPPRGAEPGARVRLRAKLRRVTSAVERPPVTGRDISPLAPSLPATIAAFHAERPAGADEDVHMLSALVDHVLDRCSRPGDTVFDPFAGFGTTLARAVALDRHAIGIELLPERVELLRTLVPGAVTIEGDARELLRLLHESGRPDGRIALVLTSPPYMTSANHEADPLMAYERGGGDYDRYLAELGLVAAQCARAVAPGGYVVWNVADIASDGVRTPLIADCTRLLTRHLRSLGTTEIVWDRYPHDLVRDALLVFQRPAAAGVTHGHATDQLRR